MQIPESRFRFVGRSFDLMNRLASFVYDVTLADGTVESFTETLEFPAVFESDLESRKDAIDRALDMIHLTLGISYWKAFCSPIIDLGQHQLTESQASFWTKVYENGLGEFFFRNHIDYRGLVRFPATSATSHQPLALSLPNRSLLGVGGGKDSIVAAKIMKASSMPFAAFVLETQHAYPIIAQVIDALKVDTVTVRRTIDPRLFALNQAGRTYNGHIPISAIYAAVGILSAILYGYRWVAVSNERSANSGNIEYLGREINHQWSKSAEFERLCNDYVDAYVVGGAEYVSVLRPLSELSIVRHMTKLPGFFPVFSSCNRNFSLTGGSTNRWCGQCPKCAFIFAAMAAFLPAQVVIEIFGKNLFADISLVPLYRELLGLAEAKPFECVGTFEENRAAFALIRQRTESVLMDTPVMRMFETESLPSIPDLEGLVAAELKPDPTVTLPPEFSRFAAALS